MPKTSRRYFFVVVVAAKTYGGAANHHYSGGILSSPITPPTQAYPQDLKPISIFILAWVFVSKPEILPLLATGVINEPGIIYLTPTR